VASRCALSVPSEAVRAVSRHLAASHRYCSAVLLMLLSRAIGIVYLRRPLLFISAVALSPFTACRINRYVSSKAPRRLGWVSVRGSRSAGDSTSIFVQHRHLSSTKSPLPFEQGAPALSLERLRYSINAQLFIRFRNERRHSPAAAVGMNGREFSWGVISRVAKRTNSDPGCGRIAVLGRSKAGPTYPRPPREPCPADPQRGFSFRFS
jgi:hypothetical protein